ncbi:hypothetical protein MKZ38_010323 [Zalerion maritima]|uniref:S-formylglutathione hydrolase n=1 Tax=Zalerion maritima TaxID=339359 RepID=A0AAD5RY38_9PEZI|nr:hypothetical protein MKZ38_010323 [Zalerion maritima]
MSYTTNATIHTMGGTLLKLSHPSASTTTNMALSIFLPPQSSSSKVPLLIYLSGLTCSPDNCTDKGFLHRWASSHGLAVAYPDTSPRGLNLPGESDSWDFGVAASFYINATAEPFKGKYSMEDYVTKDLPDFLAREFGGKIDVANKSICGHSMGGHGALTLYLKNPGMYKSVSAWAPISNPTQCPWGQNAFKGYFGGDEEGWKKHDATELVKGWKGDLKCLVDVGTGDNFYKQGQLLPENLEAAAKETGLSGLTMRYQDGYDHSYYFISTFGEDHVKHAAKHLLSGPSL